MRSVATIIGLGLCLTGCGTATTSSPPMLESPGPAPERKAVRAPQPPQPKLPMPRVETKSCRFLAAFGPGETDAGTLSIARIQSVSANTQVISKAYVRRQITARLSAIDACYNQHPPRRVSGHLRATVYWYIHTSGSRNVNAHTYGGLPYQIRYCLKRALTNVTFPPVQHTVHIRANLVFAEPGKQYSGSGSLVARQPMDVRAIDSYIRDVVAPEMASKGNLARTCFSRKQLAPGKKPVSASLRLRINGSGTVADTAISALRLDGPRLCLDQLWRGSSFSQPPPEIIDVRCGLVAHPPERGKP